MLKQHNVAEHGNIITQSDPADALYQLRRNDLDELRRRWPAIDLAVRETDRARH